MAGSSDSGGRALASGVERMHLAPAFNEGLGADGAFPSGHNGLAALCAVALCWRTHAR